MRTLASSFAATAWKYVSSWFSSAWAVVVIIGASVGFIVATLLAVKRVGRNEQRVEDLQAGAYETRSTSGQSRAKNRSRMLDR